MRIEKVQISRIKSKLKHDFLDFDGSKNPKNCQGAGMTVLEVHSHVKMWSPEKGVEKGLKGLKHDSRKIQFRKGNLRLRKEFLTRENFQID